MDKRIFFLLAGLLLTASPIFAESNIQTKAAAQAKTAAEEPAPAPAQPEAPAASPVGGYAIGPDDILRISVLQPDKLETELTVSPDGTITFPYIGTVNVKGLTLMDVQNTITTGLSDYMKYPVVTVSLKESRSRIFYVYGEVNHPGSYPILERMTVVRAISTAGGFTRIAAMNNIKLLRPDKTGTGSKTYTVDAGAVMNGKTGSDMAVEPGDVITVNQRFF